MRQMSLQNIARACGGTYCGPKELAREEITGVVIDSRQAGGGGLYVAMRGARVDGHTFIPDVFEKGALAVLSEQDLENPAGPYIRVDSCPQALKDLAEFYRSALTIPVIGIAGSVGKTSTKEMIAAVLEQKYCVLKTEGNFNNEIGLPLTLLRIRPEHEVAVVEMGISDFGEMHRLAKMARPDICVMTNIGQCHLENLIDRDGVLRAKSEMFDFLKPDGVIILNGNDDKLSEIDTVRGIRPIRYFVEDQSAERRNEFYFVTADNIQNRGLDGMDAVLHFHSETAGACSARREDGTTCSDRSGAGSANSGRREAGTTCSDRSETGSASSGSGSSCSVHEPIPGLHNIYNACAAACVGRALGLRYAEICAGIASARTIAGRTNLIQTGGITIIDDCYNANPVSMKASLDVLSLAAGRKIAVLGDMGELGEREREMHRGVGAYAAEQGIDIVLCTGELSKDLKDAASSGCTAEHFDSCGELLERLLSLIKKGDAVLVKASHSMQFSEITDALARRFR
ncbi:MAG: UDP-N-acetylmuramoyl-tripeptide--D-alanyl-D-alanine ligase [Lachnospiraceae bacterium]|nr:UDP-N-acetylmuramoyl-tripeptide--D-alanyl-D-alanine ligase [Lachnospiraceae bacterium]